MKRISVVLAMSMFASFVLTGYAVARSQAPPEPTPPELSSQENPGNETVSSPQMPAKKEKKAKKLAKGSKALKQIPEEYQAWFTRWEFMMSEAERAEFIKLAENYARSTAKKTYMFREFEKRFWMRWSKDPYGFRTNAKEVYTERMELAMEAFRDPLARSDAVKLFVILGPPDAIRSINCENVFVPIMLWHYARIEKLKANRAVLIFYQSRGMGVWRLWLPLDGMNALISNPTISSNAGSSGASGTGGVDPLVAQRRMYEECPDYRDLWRAMAVTSSVLGSGAMSMAGAAKLFEPPQSEGSENMEAIMRYSTDLALDETLFELGKKTEVAFVPTENGIHTTVRLTFFVPTDSLKKRLLGKDEHYNLEVILQVLKNEGDALSAADPKSDTQKELKADADIFTNERFRFHFPAEEIADKMIALQVDVDLYPRQYYFIVKVTDSNSKAVAQWEEGVIVPEVLLIPEVNTLITLPNASESPAIHEVPPTEPNREPATTTELPTIPISQNVPTSKEVAVAGEKQESQIPAIILLLPEKDFLTGMQSFEAKTIPEVTSVKYFLDDKYLTTKNKSPFVMAIELEAAPKKHVLRVVAYGDGSTQPLGEDAVILNQGNHSFSVQIIAPARDFRGTGFVTVKASIFTPKDQRVVKADFYVDTTLQGTITKAPWTHSVVIPSGQIAYLRVVGTLEDGTIAEDARYVNAPPYMESVTVDAVELPVSVFDDKGMSVEDLTPKDFTVTEDGKEQEIASFGYMKNLPITAGILIDVSPSMYESLPVALEAATEFVESTIGSKDRGFAVSFSDEPQLLVKPTSDVKELKKAIAGLSVIQWGGTAVYDAMMRGLYELKDLKGRRTIVLLSDGEDNREVATSDKNHPGSKYDYATLLDYAKRSGITIYVIGLVRNNALTSGTKSKLNELSASTGGKAYYVAKASELQGVYAAINRELRSQYLLTYYSSSTSKNWRKVEVKVSKPNTSTRTIRGYYP